ncbi:hypothetical protein SCOR_05590 [Sulfidibacter corallicola]|uniref:Uncharacterized protein n=1 Tax=Sulfidibacter corallicola TaxID=2818388 RepID=A0A8A4TQD5_SULCO|nr:hypothetical protein [Sulfidibacter corallicola]QTD51753.1 hypothetical protein J3U87_04725 [Sulfidibacter corallicola]
MFELKALKPLALVLATVMFLFVPLCAQEDEEECDQEPDTRVFSASFNSGDCVWINRYPPNKIKHPYWIMEPGWQVVLEGDDDGEEVRLEMTVLDEIVVVDGVHTRVIEEREFIDGELYEVSRNFFAICSRTNDIYYFGEDVDFYEDGEIVGHEGAWRAGVDGAVAGIIMPGTPMMGARFFQEIAPDAAEDRAEIVHIGSVEVGDMTFDDAVEFLETSPLDGPCETSIKYFAHDIGMVRDDDLELVESGYVFRVDPDLPLKR